MPPVATHETSTGEVGHHPKSEPIPKNNISGTGDFLGKLLAKPEDTALNQRETSPAESKDIEPIAEAKPLKETPTLLNFSELPENLQKSLKFLSAENKEKIQAIKVESKNPEVDNYQIMFTGKAAKHLFLNTFEKILHGLNLFGKSNTPDQATKLLKESKRDKHYLSKALANDSAYLQAQFSVPVDVKKKAEIKDISITESPFNLQKLLLERKDLKEVVLNAARQIINEQPNISIKADLEKIIQALEKKDKKALKEALEPFARTYSLEALKASPQADNERISGLEDTATALIAGGLSKEGINPTVVTPIHLDDKIPRAVAIKDLLLPTKDGSFNSGELTIINKSDNSIPKLIFYILPTMTDFTKAGKTLNKEESQALTEAIVKSTINADSQITAAVAQLN